MRTFLLTAICALLSGAFTLSAQEPDKYIINGKVVENFNGTQLEGLKVESYQISISTEGGTAVRTHVITTSDVAPSGPKYAEPVYVVDGEAVTKEDFNKVNTFDIERIDVIKANREDETIKRYSAEGKGVVMITLKKTKSKEYKAIGDSMNLKNVKEDSFKVTVRGSSR